MARTRAFLAAVVVAAGCSHGGDRDLVAVRLKAVPGGAHHLTRADLERSMAVMRERLSARGIGKAKLSSDGASAIVVRIPRRAASASTIQLLTMPGRIAFFAFEVHLAPPSRRGAYPLASRTPPKPEPGTTVVSCEPRRGNCLSVEEVTTRTAYYLLRTPPDMTGRDLQRSSVRADLDPQTGRDVVVMQFTRQGSRKFADITRSAARRGARRCRGRRDQAAVLRCAQHVAIVLDDAILTIPYIDFAVTPDGIPGDNGAQIDFESRVHARRVATELRSGPLPVRFVRVSR